MPLPTPLIVLLNGPPRSGKDTGAGALLAAGLLPGGAEIVRISDTVKRIAHDLYGLPPDTPVEAFDHCKDLPSEAFGGKTPREVYIWVSEVLVKPLLGEDWFGQVASTKIRRAAVGGARLVAVPDSGFRPEAMVFRADFGRHNMMLCRIHAEGRGRTYKGDSRGYIELPGVRTVDLYNETPGDPGPYVSELLAAVGQFIDDSSPSAPWRA